MAITVKHTKVSTIPDGDDSSLIRPSDWNADHALDGTVPVANGGTGADTLTGYVKGNGTSAMTASSTIPNTDITGLGTMSTQNANNVTITGGSISGATVSGYIPTTEKGAALGVATLDAGGKVPTSQIPQMGDLNYQGTWNATTNSPTLTSSTGTKGYYYVVSVAGTTNLDGITDWQIGDWAVFNGTVWQKIDNTDAVTSVNGYTGAVVLTQPDIAGTVPTTRTISTGTGLTGGGDLSANRTISFSTAAVGTWAATPTSANLAAAVTDETGSGSLVFGTNPTLANPNIDVVDFDTTYATTLTAGQLGWDGNNTLAIGMAGGNVIQHIGEDSFFYIKASSAITKGQLVMFTGAVGASGVLTGAPSTGVTNPSYIIGVAAETIALNGFGLVQCFGELTNVNTNGFNEGDILYYDSAVTGGLTSTYPTSGPIVQVAAVAKKSAGGGVIYIRVSVTQRVTASTGISVSQNGTSVTVTNTAPDQTVSITGGGTTTVTGTYPNFTVSSSDQYTGTVTSVAATAGTGISITGSPITTSGTLNITNTAPDQTVVLTAGTGISTSGTYPNFTITNTAPSSGGTVTSITAGTGLSGGTITTSGTIALANTTVSSGSYTNASITVDAQGRLTSASSGTAPVTSVTGTAPIASSGGTTPAISIPKATGSVDGYLSSTDWTTFNNKGSGTVTSVTGTAPISVATGTTTPAISITQASGSTNGYLSSTDWTTFNNKGSGTVTSVAALTLGTTGTDLSSTVANGTTTPVITLNVPTASASNRGALSAADWTTFNNKAPSVTYTTNYIPYGQGTTTPNQASNFTFDGTTQTAPIQRASNGIVVNSKTVSANYTIASGDSAMSAGPMTVASGITVTIASGSRWVVL